MAKIERKARNLYRVPIKQWKKWSESAHRLFNVLYWQMISQPSLFLHPKADAPKLAHWKTTCWNAAWIAADWDTNG